MKKLVSIALLTVLVCSFMVGLLATNSSAKGGHQVECWIDLSYPLVCDVNTCISYATWVCEDKSTYLEAYGTCCK